jgi:hypothetical protein
MRSEVTITRLYLMRAVYLLNFVILGLDVWPAILSHVGAWDPIESAA